MMINNNNNKEGSDEMDIPVMDREVVLVVDDDGLPDDRKIVDMTDWYEWNGKVGIGGLMYVGPHNNFSSPEQLRTIVMCVRKKARWCIIARDIWEWWVIDLDVLRSAMKRG